MATTGAPANIPLFDDNSPVTPIQAPLNAMATALNNYLKKTDTGWVALNPASGWVAGGNLGYRRIGDILYLRGQLNPNAGNVSGANGVCTLPSAVRPSQSYAIIGVGSGSIFAKIVVQASGSIDIATPTGNTSYMRLDGATIPLT